MKYHERRVLAASKAVGSEVELLLHIAHLADDGGTYWGDDGRLQILARFRSRGALLKVIQNLIQSGELEAVDGGYRLILPDLNPGTEE